MNLKHYTSAGFDRGRSRVFELCWIIAQGLFVQSWIPGRYHRIWLLRFFGARIGRGVDIKPGVRVKFPWRLRIGDFSWIGEDVWIDNLAPVRIGSHCCISQGVYLCTGSHDWSKITFDLKTAMITIEDQSWIAAFSVIAPGVSIHQGAVVGIGSVVTRDIEKWSVFQGNQGNSLQKRPQAQRS